MKPQSKETYMKRRAVVMEPEERKAIALMQQIRALRKDQVVRRREKQSERKAAHRKKAEKEEALRAHKEKEKRKEIMRVTGLKSKREMEPEGGRPKRRENGWLVHQRSTLSSTWSKLSVQMNGNQWHSNGQPQDISSQRRGQQHGHAPDTAYLAHGLFATYPAASTIPSAHVARHMSNLSIAEPPPTYMHANQNSPYVAQYPTYHQPASPFAEYSHELAYLSNPQFLPLTLHIGKPPG
ncbi:hypothetical protein EDD16DRAFT_1718354 [Pisolithus croceorrhizus]|nr:hypothetical protein EDD16DRAFT_1718354 [Pisolithus croceorrhizus]